MADKKPFKPLTDAERKKAEAKDERRARQRYMDQPGQVIDTTPANVKKQHAEGWKKLEAMLAKDKDFQKRVAKMNTKKSK